MERNIENAGAVPATATTNIPSDDFTDPKLFAPLWTGEKYYTVLDRLHTIIRPQRYLEIGIRDGASFRLATCPSIGIDPEFSMNPKSIENKEISLIYRKKSDDFFKENDPRTLLKGPIDLAFLDGMHLFEFLLRDFYNTEAISHPNSVIVLHDILPTEVAMTRREANVLDLPTRNPRFWAGDVWKLLKILRIYRPDLSILCLDAPPTGLALIGRLNPADETLRQNYSQIVEQAAKWSLLESGLDSFLQDQNVESTRNYMDANALRSRLSV